MNRIPPLPADWLHALRLDSSATWIDELCRLAAESYGSEVVYPPAADLWKAFELCPFDRVKVVVLGQDPYHGPGQAHGLAFSVPRGVAEPPSLRNIFKEFASDTGLTPPPSGDLTAWAREGVLLLNTSLTVRTGVAASHADGRWDPLVNRVLEVLNAEGRPLAFWLWGAKAGGGTQQPAPPCAALGPPLPARSLPRILGQQTVFNDCGMVQNSGHRRTRLVGRESYL